MFDLIERHAPFINTLEALFSRRCDWDGQLDLLDSDETNYYLRVPCPNADREHLTVTVTGHRTLEVKIGEKQTIKIGLPYDIDDFNIEGKQENGLLTVIIPKSGHQIARRVTIK